jgi:hypothetical protein
MKSFQNAEESGVLGDIGFTKAAGRVVKRQAGTYRFEFYSQRKI